MKRNAFKVKYDSRERNNIQGHIEESEYLLSYLADFPDFAARFAIVNNHAEMILVDRSLQVYSGNELHRDLEFYPVSSFSFKTKEVPNSSQLDRSLGLSESEFNIFCDCPQGNEVPIGFLGAISFGDFEFETMLLRDISHRHNFFGMDIFRNLSSFVCDRWDKLPDDFKIRSYESSQVSLGMDAEFELIRNKERVRAGDYFSYEGEIGTDGNPATLELRPHYANSSNQLLNNLNQLMQKVYEGRFEIETSGDVEALGAHIHFGVQRSQTFINLLDFWIAKPLWHLNGWARDSYKHLSESRITDSHCGFEYRSLPSGILKDKKLASIVLKVIEGLAKDWYIDGKEISLHPCKEDYLKYLTEDEWKKWKVFKKDGDRQFKAESWDCKRRGELHQRKIPRNLELDIPIQVYLYNLRKERGDVFYLSPFNTHVIDYLIDDTKDEFEVEHMIAESVNSLGNAFYTIGIPYKIHSKPTEYNMWLANFITFLNSSSLEEIPEL